MNLNHLRYFAAVVKRGSFRRASEDLNISQPALSNSLKKLEDLLGAPLLERSPQGVFPTEYGEALNHFSMTAINAVNRARVEIDLLRKGSRGHIRIGAPTGMIEQVVPMIIANIAENRPNFSYSVTRGYLFELLEQMVDGELDFLVTTYWPEANITENFLIQHLAKLNVSIYARTSHPLANKPQVSLQDLSSADWIIPESPGLRSLIRRMFGEDHQSTLPQSIFSNHPHFIYAMMEQMDLLSIIPDYVVERFVSQGRFVKLNFPQIDWDLSAGIVELEGRTQTPAMAAFREAAIRIGKEKLH